MMKKSLQLITLFIFCGGVIMGNAQSTVLTSGGNATGSGGTASFSVGQIDYLAINSGTGSVSQGVQQPFSFSVLPVTLLSFKATKQEGKVVLKWETSTEVNSSKFVIQRSNNGITFLDIKQIPAAGNSSIVKKYTVDDMEPLQGLNYYRIAMMDRDGSLVVSKVNTVNFAKNSFSAIVYPNPAKHNIVLKIEDAVTGMYSFKLFDPKGNLLLANVISGDVTNIKISTFAAGTYYLKLTDQNNKEIKSFQIVKN